MSSIGVTPPKRTVRPFDLDHGDSPRPLPSDADAARDQAAQVRHVLGDLLHDPARGGEQHLQDADPEQDREPFGLTPQCTLQEHGRSCVEDAGDDRAPEAEDAADQHGRQQHERVLDGKAAGPVGCPTCAASRPPATPVMNDASAKAHSL